MRKWICLMLAALMLVSPAFALSFTDSAGIGLTLDTPPQRVAVLFSSLAEIWLEAGGEIAVTVGESIERGFCGEDIPLVDAGSGKSINAELLLSCAPDFVICSTDTPAQAELAGLLNRAGIPCAQMCIDSLADYLYTLEVMTAITENPAAYETSGAAVQAQVEALLKSEGAQALAGMRILFVRAGSTARSTKAKGTQDHFACAMLAELGCINIADEAPILLDGLSMESILAADPDYVLFAMQGDEAAARANIESMLQTPAWAQLAAVRQGRWAILPKELFHFKPNARWAQAYAYLINLLSEAS